MFHRSSESNRGRWFRPSLEILEDRTLLSAMGDLLTQFGTAITGNVAVAESLVVATNLDVSNFENHPSLANFARLYTDANQLQGYAATVSLQSTALSIFVSTAEKTNQLSSPEAFVLDATVSGVRTVAAQLRNAAQDALADAGAALFALLGNGSTKLAPIPTAPVPTSPPSGSVPLDYSSNVTPAPGAASASGPNITESVFVTAVADNRDPVTAQITYSATDGTTGDSGKQLIAPGASQTVSLTMMPCSAGVTGTWTVYVEGQVVKTNTTTFTP